MYCEEESIVLIKQKIDMLKYISSKVKLEKKGNLYLGKCPFHSTHTSAFVFDEEQQLYKCYECGKSGDIIDFVMNYHKKSFSDAVSMLAMITGIKIKKNIVEKEFYRKQKAIKEINKMTKEFYQSTLLKDQTALAYVKNRNITKEMIETFELGYANPKNQVYAKLKESGFKESDIMASGIVAMCDKDGKKMAEEKYYDKFYSRLIFPIVSDNGIVLGFGGRVMTDKKPKYINSQETIVYDKSANVFGLNIAKNSKPDYFLLCEGYMDVISLHQSGFDNAVASLGTALTMNQIIKLSRYKKKIILLYDSDEAGINAAVRAIPMLKTCKMESKVANQSPFKDPDEFISKFGKEAFRERIETASDAEAWLVANILNSERKNYSQKITDMANVFEMK